MTVYLLHLTPPVGHAKHYLGSTNNLKRRLTEHRSGRGARLLEVAVVERGGDFVVARTWEGDRALERKLKRRKEGPRLCPICRKEVT